MTRHFPRRTRGARRAGARGPQPASATRQRRPRLLGANTAHQSASINALFDAFARNLAHRLIAHSQPDPGAERQAGPMGSGSSGERS